MLIYITSRAVIPIYFFILACMPGCVALSDSSAMRIEVEVYKGPLSLEPKIQLQELYSWLIEARIGMLRILQFAENAQSESYGISHLTIETVKADATLLLDRLAASFCNLEPERADCMSKFMKNDLSHSSNLETFHSEMTHYQVAKNLDILKVNTADLATILSDISQTAAAMKAAAFRYATASTAGQPPDQMARIAATYFIEGASEYGNQIEARADALLKQLREYGRDRRELPLSTHLRETEPTDFLHLFDWMDGHINRWWDYLHFNFSPNVPERIKIIERLYANHFWSKINTVYASGRGKTQMAFIKDETGNWNLKSFDNDPTELLEAYTNVAKKALQKAAELAASASTGGGPTSISLARSLVSFATESEPDKAISQTPSAGTLSLVHLRTRLANKLDPALFKADFEKETELLNTVQSKEKEAADARKGSNDSLTQTAEQALVTARTNLSQHRQQIVARWETIFNDHSNLVDILSSTVKNK